MSKIEAANIKLDTVSEVVEDLPEEFVKAQNDLTESIELLCHINKLIKLAHQSGSGWAIVT